MARIHRLPVVLQGETGRLLTDELIGLMRAGASPGPRRHQIEVLRQSIREALRELPTALAGSVETLPTDDPTRRAAEAAVRRFMEEVERLVAMSEPVSEGETDMSSLRHPAQQEREWGSPKGHARRPRINAGPH